MAKTGYRFNPETLSYDRIHVSVKKKLWSLVVKFFSSLSLALVIFLIVSAIVDSPKEKALKREKEEILAQYHILNNELERMDEVLKNLETRDDNIYRVIFESEPIDASIRRAGSGGVNRYESLKDMDNAELIINTSKKLDELSKALYIQSKSYERKSNLTVRFNPVNSGISAASVAESNIRFFNPGSWVIISAISSWKPNSNDLSNSSIIKVSMVSGLKLPFDKWSVIRPGVPIIIAG